MKKHGVALRLHGLRHSHASHLLAENVHPKIVQERLGHHSITVTMDVYSHLMPNMQAEGRRNWTPPCERPRRHNFLLPFCYPIG